MARKKTNGRLPSPPSDQDPANPSPPPETTGRFLVVLDDANTRSVADAVATVKSITGAKNVAASGDYEENAIDVADIETADAMVFSELGIAVVSEDVGRGLLLSEAASSGRVLAVEPEPIFHALETAPPDRDYFRGYKAAVDHLYEQMNGHRGELLGDVEEAPEFADSIQLTWGLRACRVPTSRFGGQGIRLCVLDTGFDLDHPDFIGRRVVHQSFVPGQTAQDGHGHGTHCVGTACGPRVVPGGARRYGVAYASDIYVGKVLSNAGSGNGSWILAGMEWAINQKCPVISMSLGNSNPAVSTAYETAGRRALDRGCLVVAAAGNHRQSVPNPPGLVGQPANSPAILAVGAVDSALRLASFSVRSNPVSGGKVDLVAPGVATFSSVPTPALPPGQPRNPSWPARYHAISGTSMATPHVAGIAALVAQAYGLRGAALWNVVTRLARPVAIPVVDAGAGLAQAPQ